MVQMLVVLSLFCFTDFSQASEIECKELVSEKALRLVEPVSFLGIRTPYSIEAYGEHALQNVTVFANGKKHLWRGHYRRSAAAFSLELYADSETIYPSVRSTAYYAALNSVAQKLSNAKATYFPLQLYSTSGAKARVFMCLFEHL